MFRFLVSYFLLTKLNLLTEKLQKNFSTFFYLAKFLKKLRAIFQENKLIDNTA